MSRILFDRNIPIGLRRRLVGHTIETTDDRGWSTLTNGELIAHAEEAGVLVILTADQNVRYQQNLAGRVVALVVLSTNAWPVVRAHVPAIQAATDRARGGSYEVVSLPRPPLRRRPSGGDAG